MQRVASDKCSVVALSGGIGGAKLALGLSRVLAPGCLTVVANTGDDFEHLGLAISPDLDTLLYTLGGIADPDKGWGRRDETWTFMQALAALGGPAWFQLGDGDLATHVERTRRLAAGETLTAIMDDFRRRLGVACALLPMSDDPVRTRVRTTEGWIDFQDYFVRQRCAPAVIDIEFRGVERARPQPSVLGALADPALRAVVICPSNPLISIEPILAVPGLRRALAACRAPVIAVSPLVGGKALKGPTAKMLGELGGAPDNAGIARRYQGVIDGLVIDAMDAADADRVDVAVTVAPTVMVTLQDRENLARVVADFADRLRGANAADPGARRR
ncbi:MAG: 2-phospho-L-lactate transferase [Betaproteobacteria bacterium]|nr:2-phospho-L-lactate transferase [Betaproteobacteria bacterium]